MILWFLVLGKTESKLYAAYVFHAEEHDFGNDCAEVAPDRRVDEDDHDDEARHAYPAVIFPDIVGQESEKQMRTVKRRNRQKVEKAEHDAHASHRDNEILEINPRLLLRNES